MRNKRREQNRVESSYFKGEETVVLDIIDEELGSDFNENSTKNRGFIRALKGLIRT